MTPDTDVYLGLRSISQSFCRGNHAEDDGDTGSGSVLFLSTTTEGCHPPVEVHNELDVP